MYFLQIKRQTVAMNRLHISLLQSSGAKKKIKRKLLEAAKALGINTKKNKLAIISIYFQIVAY